MTLGGPHSLLGVGRTRSRLKTTEEKSVSKKMTMVLAVSAAAQTDEVWNGSEVS